MVMKTTVKELMEANPAYITITVFPANVEIVVPDIEIKDTLQQIWKDEG